MCWQLFPLTLPFLVLAPCPLRSFCRLASLFLYNFVLPVSLPCPGCAQPQAALSVPQFHIRG